MTMPRAITHLLIALSATAMLQAQPGMPGTPMLPPGMTVVDDNDPFTPNTFTGSFRLEMRSTHNGADDPQGARSLRYWGSTDMALTEASLGAMGVTGTLRILVDLKGKWQYMLMDDPRSGRTAMKLRKKKVLMAEKPTDATAMDVRLTGEKRVIQGHACVKVVATGTEGSFTGWVAEGLPSPFGDMQRVVSSGDPLMDQRMGGVQGLPLEFEWKDARGMDGMRCTVHDVVVGRVDPAMFSLDGYRVMEMPALGR